MNQEQEEEQVSGVVSYSFGSGCAGWRGVAGAREEEDRWSGSDRLFDAATLFFLLILPSSSS